MKIFLDVLYKVLMENKNIVESMVVLILEIELIVKFLEMEFELF